MRHIIKFANLHDPLFMNGSNLGTKLGAQRERPVQMQYDTELMCLAVYHKGNVTLIPHATVSSMDLANPAPLKFEWNETAPLKTAPPPRQSSGPIVAQVENPTQPSEGRSGRGFGKVA